jgi:hypothetical protein
MGSIFKTEAEDVVQPFIMPSHPCTQPSGKDNPLVVSDQISNASAPFFTPHPIKSGAYSAAPCQFSKTLTQNHELRPIPTGWMSKTGASLSYPWDAGLYR